MTPTTERQRIPLEDAQIIACRLLDIFEPVSVRIEVAGSIRRRMPTVKDIEIVLIGREDRIPTDLFGGTFRVVDVYSDYCDQLLADGVLSKRVGKNGHTAWGYGARYAWFHGHGGEPIALDLFGTEAARWGMTMMIRTGPADWNLRWVRQRIEGGTILPFGMRVADGWLWRGNRRIETPEETDVFREIEVDYLEPWERA